jgi:hypothetical protein
MFKSIFQRLFWTNAAILMLVFVSVAVSVSIFAANYTMSKQVESIISISDTVEHWSAAMQIEDNQTIYRDAYKQTLKSWSEFIKADIIVVNLNGELINSSCDIVTVPEEYLSDIATELSKKQPSTALIRKRCFLSACR